MKSVWKYPVDVGSEWFTLDIPGGGTFCALHLQDGMPVMWFLVDPEKREVRRKFLIFMTGQHLDDELANGLEYISTFQRGALVYHVFEKPRRVEVPGAGFLTF